MGNKLEVPIVDLSGKVAIVTGGNTGIGYELVKGLAEMGAHTIMASRSEERATAAVACIKESSEKNLKVEFMRLDLGSIQSTKDFVRAFKENNLPLHILINNAGIAWIPYTKTDDGFERTYQVNHLYPFLLTLELLPIVLETASTSGDGRILFVTSNAHNFGANFNPDNLNSEIQYDRMKAYPNTKLYNVMTIIALQRRLQNMSVTVSAQHPGLVATEIERGYSDCRFISFLGSVANATIARSPKDGAATTLNCAINPALNSQEAFYYDSCKVTAPNPDARNETYQEELWRRSVKALRDHLSPEILEKYGAPPSPTPLLDLDETEKGKEIATTTATDTVTGTNQ
ncbi:retinol dehydrogenase 12-like [Halichondria panicea]|uniref:retinol dehydrogenase 12-like n=1 Tax=Halichondria panicea TaxID=6063 RepID=UPI00312B7B35